MQASLKSAAILFVAATSGWLVRGVAHERPSALAPVAQAAPVTSEAIATPPPMRVDVLGVPPEPQGGKRNLFAYVEEPVAPVAMHVEHVAPVAVYVPPPVAEPIAAKPEPPQFPYRYIGQFGTERTRVAAFTRDGTVVTVRAGDRIDAQWSLRRIGIESVELEASTGERITVRL